MAVSLITFNPNTKAQSSDVNTNFSNLASGVQTASHRAFSWGVIGTLLTGDMQGMQYIVPQDVTVIGIWAKTTSGTATIRLQKDTTDIKTSLAVTSTATLTSSFDATVITTGQVLTLDVTAASGVDVFITLETQVTALI